MRLRIEPWLTVRFSPPILRHPQHDFREVRSGRMRSVRARSSTLPAVSPRKLVTPANRSRNCALPYRFTDHEKRALQHTKQ